MHRPYYATMQRVHLSYSLSPDATGPMHNPLMHLLDAVHQNGSISAAARALNLSYRHVWGELKRWEAHLQQPLIVWERGQHAKLSALGEKLLWAERQARARLAPQIATLQADLERAFAVAFDPGVHVLTLYASHDAALVALREHAAQHAHLHLDIRFCGSVDALRALNEGRCAVAGFHVRRHSSPHSLSLRTYRALLKPRRHVLISFAQRTQGLIVAPGNPLQLNGLQDIAQRKARFVNRATGCGTRLLLDELLTEAGIQPGAIQGYDCCENSHSAVAQAVASGSADAGFGIEAAARACGLDFIALTSEDYYLACLPSVLEQPPVTALRQTLLRAPWQQLLLQLPGYLPPEVGSATGALYEVSPLHPHKP